MVRGYLFLSAFIVLLLLCVNDASAETILKLTVASDGIYQITGDELMAVGIELPVDASGMSIENMGNAVPMQILNMIGDQFSQSSSIEFYGRKIDRNNPSFKYTERNVYFLTLDGESAGKKFSEVELPSGVDPVFSPASFKELIHAEDDTFYNGVIPLPDSNDRWFWGERIRSGQERLINVNIVNLDAAKASCGIRVYLRGNTNDAISPDHHTVISINNTEVMASEWDGRQGHLISKNRISPCPLNEGDNTIRIWSAPTQAVVDSIYLNWIELDYFKKLKAENHRLKFSIDALDAESVEGAWQIHVNGFQEGSIELFDITGVENGDVIKFKRARDFLVIGNTLEFIDTVNTRKEYYAVSSSGKKRPTIEFYKAGGLKDTSNQADYIIISNSIFLNSLGPLIDHRKEFSELSVYTVDIDNVYDAFSYGIADPVGIKEFLTYAYYNWAEPKPAYVLLVGDGSVDFKGLLANGFTGLMPVHMFETFDNMEAPDDNWFVTITPSDPVPDMMIGRLPVKTVEDLRVVISKIITYETGEVEEWNKNILFVTDNDSLDMVPSFSKPETGRRDVSKKNDEEFNTVANILAELVPDDFNPLRLYLSDFLEESGQDGIIAGENAQRQFIENLNKGSLISTYIGHGSIDIWAAEEIFNSVNVVELDNESRLTFMIAFNCLNGYFVSPFEGISTPVPLAEAFLLEKNKGAVATWMPTWLEYTFNHQLLGEGFFKAVFQDDITTIGAAILAAKTYADVNEVSEDTLNIFTLFGDPALKLRMDAATESSLVPEVGGAANTKEDSGGGCFIATAAFGTGLEKHVMILKEFRDRFLLTNTAGRKFTEFYYRYSPPVADNIAGNEPLRLAVRIALLPMIAFSYFMLNVPPVLKVIIGLLLIVSIFLIVKKVLQKTTRQY